LQANQRPPVPQGRSLNAYDLLVLAQSPKAYWRMDEASGNFADYSGNGIVLNSITGSPNYRQNVGPRGAKNTRFQGGVGAVRTVVASTATNNFAIEMWIYPEAVSANNEDTIRNGNLGSNGWGLLIHQFSAGAGGGFPIAYFAGGVAIGTSATTLLTRSVWNYVILARDSGTWKYWINNVLDATTSASHTPNTPTAGHVGFNASSNRQISVANCAIYDSVPTTAQRTARYNAMRGGAGAFGPIPGGARFA
jgi:hypothetical protein